MNELNSAPNLVLRGKIKSIAPTETIQTKSGKSFTKRSLVLETTKTLQDGTVIVSTPSLTFSGTKCYELDQYKTNMEVSVWFDVMGQQYVTREGSVRYFTELRAWRIESAQQQAPTAQHDDLPF